MQESKERANQALKQIPIIRAIINDTEAQTEDAQGALLTAKQTVNGALQTAQAANDMAKEANKKVKDMMIETDRLFKNATSLYNEADLMADRVQNTEIEFEELLKQIENNGTLLKEAKDKVT